MHVRFDNLGDSPWLNLKVGKFELDNLVSEKRFLFLSDNGGSYSVLSLQCTGKLGRFRHGRQSDRRGAVGALAQQLHALQRGGADLELMASPGGENFSSYDANLNFSQAFDGGKMGVERIGGFAYLGQRPTSYQTVGGDHPWQ